MNNFLINENILMTVKTQVVFKHKIRKVLNNNDIYVVLFDVLQQEDDYDNIYGVDVNGKIVWRIEKDNCFSDNINQTHRLFVDIFPIDEDICIEQDSCFFEHSKNENAFKAMSFFGTNIYVDYKTGKIVGRGTSCSRQIDEKYFRNIMNNYKIEENKLITDKFAITFKYKIDKVLYHNDVFVVLIDIMQKDEYDNIYGVDLNGKVIWRIEKDDCFPNNISKTHRAFVAIFPMDKDMFTDTNPPVLLFPKNDSAFRTVSFLGTQIYVDYQTGKIVGRGMTTRF